MINQQAEMKSIPVGKSGANTSNIDEGAVNEVGSGGVKARKMGRYDGKCC